MLTINEIKQRKSAGKRKWRKSLLPFIKPLFDENMPMDAIAKFLVETHDFTISQDILYQIKFRFYTPEKSDTKFLGTKVIIQASIEQNQESSTAERLFSQMKQANQKTNEFDFGNDF